MDISDHKSPNYGAFLSNEEIVKVVGVSSSRLELARRELMELGFSSVVPSGHNDHLRGVGEPIPLR